MASGHYNTEYRDTPAGAWYRESAEDEDRFAMALTQQNHAVTQLQEWNFNSMARMGDIHLGVNENGLYTIGNDTYHGGAIDSSLELYLDFDQIIRLRSLYVGLETDGMVGMVLTFDDRTANSRTFYFGPNQIANRQHGTKYKKKCGRGDMGRYLRLKFVNYAGSDFSLDFIEAIYIPLGSRRGQIVTTFVN